MRIASARSPISRAPFAVERIAARIASGLAARIVVGDDDMIGVPGRDLAHDRPLARVAVAAGAEDHDELALRVGPERLQRLGERIGLVRVVDENRRAVVLADKLQPALRALEIFEAAEHLVRAAAGADHEARRDQRVLDLELAHQRQPDRMLSGRDAR